MSDRAQAHTVEGFTAALLLVGAVIFAIEATAVTPLTASTSNQHIENQQQAMANDLLTATEATGSMEEAVLYWNTSSETFYNPDEHTYYVTGGPPSPPNDFGRALNETFSSKRIAFNVYVTNLYADRYNEDLADGERELPEEVVMVYMGEPSDHAVVASKTIVIYEGTQLINEDGSTSSEDVTAAGFYANESVDSSHFDSVSGANEIHTVLEVRIVAWQM